MSFDFYFDDIYCINMRRSTDRWEHVMSECQKHDIRRIKRFEAYDFNDYTHLPENIRSAMKNAMCGCTSSHGALLHMIGHHGMDKTLILEDDFEILHDDFNDRFKTLIKFVPDDWQILYLGAGYGEPPISRVNEHIIKVGMMKTTSSYAVRGKYARFIAPFICGCSGPDDLISGFNHLVNAYCLQPRLMGQYENKSTIWGKVTHNTQSMTDTRHEKMV